MRKELSVGIVVAALALCASRGAEAGTVALTAGFLNFYLGDPGAAHLVGNGFEVSSTASRGWPAPVRPGRPVDFSTDVGLSECGSGWFDPTRL